jgi:hypothetical protein
MGKALVMSLVVHVALVGVFRPSRAVHAAPLPEIADRWSGTTAELPSAGGQVYEVALEARPAAPAPAEAKPDDAKAVEVSVVAAEPVEAKPVVAAREPVARAAPKPAAKPARASERPPGHAVGARPGGEGRGDGAASGGAFGAEGPGSPRDLGRAFTRAIPPACTADPLWASLPAGDAGKLEIEVRIDAQGHMLSAEPRGTSRPEALLHVLRRTVPLLQAGTFAAREGATTAGTEILEITARVRDAEGEAAPDQLAFEYGRGKGKARFSTAGGRQVEITLRVVKTEGR